MLAQIVELGPSFTNLLNFILFVSFATYSMLWSYGPHSVLGDWTLPFLLVTYATYSVLWSYGPHSLLGDWTLPFDSKLLP
jgi:hypothetical protein